MKRSNQEMKADAKGEEDDALHELPQDWKDFIEVALGGTEITFVCGKMLCRTDVDDECSIRLPTTALSTLHFLREEERKTVSSPTKKGKTIVFPVWVVGQSLKKHLLNFTTRKPNEKTTEQYFLTQVTEEFRKENELRSGILVRFWSFRAMENEREELHMAIVIDEADNLPQDWRNFIKGTLGGTELNYVCQKILSISDTEFQSRCIILPRKDISSLDFFREDELEIVSLPDTSKRSKPKSVPVMVIGPSRRMHLLNFRIWQQTYPNNKVKKQYALTQASSEFLIENDLKVGDEVQFWSFRAMENQREELYMALVVVGRPLSPIA